MGKAQLKAVWRAVLGNAGLEDGAVMLLPIAGAPPGGGAAAKWFFPREELVDEYEFPLDRGQLERANAPAARNGHRIAVWAGVEEVPLAAKLRHEVEHALQWDECGERFIWFDCRMGAAVAKAFGPRRGGGRV